VLLQLQQYTEDDFLVVKGRAGHFDEVSLEQFPTPALLIGERIELRGSDCDGRWHVGISLINLMRFGDAPRYWFTRTSKRQGIERAKSQFSAVQFGPSVRRCVVLVQDRSRQTRHRLPPWATMSI
jgi:hypothetical protein